MKRQAREQRIQKRRRGITLDGRAEEGLATMSGRLERGLAIRRCRATARIIGLVRERALRRDQNVRKILLFFSSGFLILSFFFRGRHWAAVGP